MGGWWVYVVGLWNGWWIFGGGLGFVGGGFVVVVVWVVGLWCGWWVVMNKKREIDDE